MQRTQNTWYQNLPLGKRKMFIQTGYFIKQHWSMTNNSHRPNDLVILVSKQSFINGEQILSQSLCYTLVVVTYKRRISFADLLAMGLPVFRLNDFCLPFWYLRIPFYYQTEMSVLFSRHPRTSQLTTNNFPVSNLRIWSYNGFDKHWLCLTMALITE